jgi:hypothetical protein
VLIGFWGCGLTNHIRLYVYIHASYRQQNSSRLPQLRLNICYNCVMKTCNKCQTTRSYSEFHKQKSTNDGHTAWCKQCYHEYWRGRYKDKRKFAPLKKTSTHRECRMCGEMKEFADFSKKTKRLHSYCVDCRRLRGLTSNLQRYGLTPESYIEMEKAQGGVCAICKEPEREKKRMAVDHNHSCCPGLTSCGKCIRGLLCTRCNKGLGVFGDDRDLLLRAANYLKL